MPREIRQVKADLCDAGVRQVVQEGSYNNRLFMTKYNGNYYEMLAHLRADASRARWTAATRYRAPHKPLLLLAVMDLIAQNIIDRDFIEPTPRLMEVVDLYWAKVIGQENANALVMPFSHLQSDGFWHLVPVPGMEVALAVGHVRSLGQLNQLALGARLDDALFGLLRDVQERDNLRRVLIETYFAPELRSTLVEVGRIRPSLSSIAVNCWTVRGDVSS